jgi:hypothetical protein
MCEECTPESTLKSDDRLQMDSSKVYRFDGGGGVCFLEVRENFVLQCVPI